MVVKISDISKACPVCQRRIDTVVAIYLLYGIGLEAHQQNTMALLGPPGKPRGLLIRDFGDGRTYAPLLEERSYALQPHVQPGILPTEHHAFVEEPWPTRSLLRMHMMRSSNYRVQHTLSNPPVAN